MDQIVKIGKFAGNVLIEIHQRPTVSNSFVCMTEVAQSLLMNK